MIESPSSFWSWWLKKFRHSAYIYGHPVHWNEPNLDFLASALGELPFGIIYYAPEDRFYFRDYVFESAYRPTSPVKLTVVGKKLVNESVVGATRPQIEAAKMLFESVGEWVKRAKSILLVEDHFFTGNEGRRRWIEGRFVDPVDQPTVALFADSRIVHGKGCVLPLSDAYRWYNAFCLEMGYSPLKKQLFKEIFSSEVKVRWKQGLRNDLKIDGKSLQGWGGLSLSMESAVSEVPKTDSLEGKQHLIGGPETAAPPPSSD
jgi:hypothetical protein